MKRSMEWVCGAAAMLFVSCVLPSGEFGSGLANGTFSYKTGPHSKITVSFDYSGNTGLYEESSERLAYANVADYLSGDPAKKVWIQTEGVRGRFSYDRSAKTADVTVSQIYYPAASATLIDDNVYSGYAWQDLRTRYAVCNPGLSSYTLEYRGSAVITDKAFLLPGLSGDAKVFISQGGELWSNTTTAVTSSTVSGVNTVIVEERRSDKRISGTVLSATNSDVFSYSSGSGVSRKITQIYTVAYKVLGWRASGKSLDSRLFTDAWKAGNTVSFSLERTMYEDTYYDGDDAPPAPELHNRMGGSREGSPHRFVDGTPAMLNLVYEYRRWQLPYGAADYFVDRDQTAADPVLD